MPSTGPNTKNDYHIKQITIVVQETGKKQQLIMFIAIDQMREQYIK